jgi:hypothetical protein
VLTKRLSARRAAAALLLAGLPLTGCSESAGADSERGAVDGYVEALNDKDEAALTRLVVPSAHDGIDDVLDRYGGRSIALTDVVIKPLPNPNFADAVLVGTMDRGDFSENLHLEKKAGRWLVSFYPADGPGGAAPTAGTRRPST